MKKADQKIIEANPGLNAYELFNKGISQEAYEALLDKESESQQKKSNVAQPTEVQKVQMPTVTPHRPHISFPQASTSNVNIKNLQTGKVTSMSRRVAEQMARSAPKQFQIVP